MVSVTSVNALGEERNPRTDGRTVGQTNDRTGGRTESRFRIYSLDVYERMKEADIILLESGKILTFNMNIPEFYALL